MTEISILDLQNLRHLIGGYSTTHCKMTDYAAQATDPQVKQLFQEAADSALKNKQDLMKFFIRGNLKMDEKTMVSDALVGVNGELKMFGDMIPQTEKQRTETVPQTDSKPV